MGHLSRIFTLVATGLIWWSVLVVIVALAIIPNSDWSYSGRVWRLIYFIKTKIGWLGYTVFASACIYPLFRRHIARVFETADSHERKPSIYLVPSEPTPHYFAKVGIAWLLSALFGAVHLAWIVAVTGNIPEEWIKGYLSSPLGATNLFSLLFVFDAAFSYFWITYPSARAFEHRSWVISQYVRRFRN